VRGAGLAVKWTADAKENLGSIRVHMSLGFEWEFSDSPGGDVYLVADCRPCTTLFGIPLACAPEHTHESGLTHQTLVFEIGQDPGSTILETPPLWWPDRGDADSDTVVEAWVDMIEATVVNYTPYVIAHLQRLRDEHDRQ
jgi:hypothetical protein